jgi:hypothetical protein
VEAFDDEASRLRAHTAAKHDGHPIIAKNGHLRDAPEDRVDKRKSEVTAANSEQIHAGTTTAPPIRSHTLTVPIAPTMPCRIVSMLII